MNESRIAWSQKHERSQQETPQSRSNHPCSLRFCFTCISPCIRKCLKEKHIAFIKLKSFRKFVFCFLQHKPKVQNIAAEEKKGILKMGGKLQCISINCQKNINCQAWWSYLCICISINCQKKKQFAVVNCNVCIYFIFSKFGA